MAAAAADDAIALHFKAARQHQELLQQEVLQRLQSIEALLRKSQGHFRAAPEPKSPKHLGQKEQKEQPQLDPTIRSSSMPLDESDRELFVIPAPARSQPPPPAQRVASLTLPGLVDSSTPHQDNSIIAQRVSSRRMAASKVKLSALNRAVHTSLLETSADAEMPTISMQDGFRWMSSVPEPLLCFFRLCAIATFTAIVSVRMLTDVRGVSYHFLAATTLLYSVVGVHCIRRFRFAMQSENLKLADQQLGHLARKFKLDGHWSSVAEIKPYKFFAIWVIIGAADLAQHIFKVWNMIDYEMSMSESESDGLPVAVLSIQAVAAATFVIYSALVMLVVVSQARILSGLDRMLDLWCNDLMGHRNFTDGAESWNSLQACIKSVARALSASFMILQIFSSVGLFFLLGGIAGMSLRTESTTSQLLAEAASAFPLLFLFMVSTILMSRAAALTEKCRAIPSFVNQLPSIRHLDPDRQYLCRYVAHSSTGFSLHGVTITQELFLKQLYFLGTLLSGIAGVLARAYI